VTPVEIRVPDIGDFADVPVIEILVAPGDEVAVEDPLVTLESDKATMDVPSPVAGTVGQLRVEVGDRVSEGSVLLTLDPVQEPDGAPSGSAQAAGARPTADAAKPADAGPGEHRRPGSPTGNGLAGPGVSPAAVISEERPPQPSNGAGYDAQVLVLGAGPGGYTAAFRAADLGLRTVLVERHERLGGVCLNVGCIPSKALLHAARVLAEAQEMAQHGVRFGEPEIDLEALLGWKQGVVDRLTGGLAQLARQRSVEVVRGEGTFTGHHSLAVGDREITFEHAIIAAGSRPVKLPQLPDDERVIDSTGALSPASIPERMLVIGGGIIGLEMACVYDALGARVTVVEMLEQLIPGADADLVKPLHGRIAERYEEIHLGTQVLGARATREGLQVELSREGGPLQFDRVLVAVGRQPNGGALGAERAGVIVDERGFIAVDRHQRTNVPHIFAIGDVCGGPLLAHKATHEGKVAAEVIAGVPGAAFDPRAIPSVAYTDPELAWMGLTETAASAEGIEVEKAVFPWSASGRALGLGRPEGITKLLFEPGSRRLLGAGIVGVGAGDLIAETVLALEHGADAEDVALTIHPHPTLSETVGLAAELEAGSITDLLPRRARTAAR
jgi:dihydrolipoamide dehydrogenase